MLTEINIVGIPPRHGMYRTFGSTYKPVLDIVTRMLKMVKSDGYWSEIAPEDLSFYIAERSKVPISREILLPRLTHCQNELEVIDELLGIGFRLAPIPLNLSVHQFQSSREEYMAFIVPKSHPPEVKASQKATKAIFISKKEFREILTGNYLVLTEKRRQEKEILDNIQSSMDTVKSLLDRGRRKERTAEARHAAKKPFRERLLEQYFGLEAKRRQQKEQIGEIESSMDTVKSSLDKLKESGQDLEERARMKSEDHTGLPTMRLRLWGLEEQGSKDSKDRESALNDGVQSDEELDNNAEEKVRPRKKARGSNKEAVP
jgi:hypothetical protein